MNTSALATQDLSGFNVLFVHSALDEYGLTAQEFRVYCHLARRAANGVAFPGIKSIAEVCILSKGTVIKSIKSLEQKCMIQVSRKEGCTTNYRITKAANWLNKVADTGPNGGTLPVQTEEWSGPNGGMVRSKVGNATGPNGGTEVHPTKYIQLSKESTGLDQKPKKPKRRKAEPITDPAVFDFPIELNTEAFQKSWMAWVGFRMKLKRVIEPVQFFQHQLDRTLDGLTEPEAIDCLEQSLANQWQGLFPKKAKDRSFASQLGQQRRSRRPTEEDYKKGFFAGLDEK